MGDILSLVEKAQQQFDTANAKKLRSKIRKEQFNLQDLLEQIEKVKRMGSMADLLSMMPGGKKALETMNEGEEEDMFKDMLAIIRAMTPQERTNPRILNGSRRRRIARGSGVHVSDVNSVLKQLRGMRKMMKGALKMQQKGRQPSTAQMMQMMR